MPDDGWRRGDEHGLQRGSRAELLTGAKGRVFQGLADIGGEPRHEEQTQAGRRQGPNDGQQNAEGSRQLEDP